MAVVVHCDESQVGLRVAMPSHIAALAAVGAAILVVSATIDSTQMATMLLLLAVVGASFSLVLRASRLPRGAAYVVSLLGAAGAALLIASDPRLVAIAWESRALMTRDLVLLALLAYLGVLTTFFHVRSGPQLFSLVVCLSVFGVAGQLNINPEVIGGFFVYVVAAIFLLGYHRLVHQGVVHSAQAMGTSVMRAVGDHLLATCLVFVLVLASGTALGFGLSKVSPQIFSSALITMNRVLSLQRRAELLDDASQTLDVGLGPVLASNRPLFYVQASEPAYWRTRVFGFWTGASWSPPSDPRSDANVSSVREALGRVQTPRRRSPKRAHAVLEPGDVHRERVIRQHFSLSTVVTGAIPAAAVPVDAESRWANLNVDAWGSLVCSKILPAGASYDVTSCANTDSPSILRRAGTDYPQEVADLGYLLVAASAEPLRPVAERICAEAETPYDKVMALIEYLEKTCVYRLSAAPYDRSRDVAVQFVLERKEGTCAEFATALAVMARLVGVPARVVSGFSTGTWDEERQVWVVTEANRHAWVEVFFPNVGWVPFDVQPEQVMGVSLPQRIFTALSAGSRSLVYAVKRYLVVLTIILPLLWVVLYSKQDVLWRLVRPRRPVGIHGQLEQLYSTACRQLARAIGKSQPSTAPGEIIARVRQELAPYPAARRLAERTLDDMVRYRFAPRGPTQAELRDLRSRVKEIGIAARHVASLKRRGLPRLTTRVLRPAASAVGQLLSK